ncbi:Ankyrin repeat domain-containing protein 13C, partial [Branchiostoma belcheri]
ETEMEIEEEVDVLMSSDVVAAQMSTKAITFQRAQTGWVFREDKTESVGTFSADYYHIGGILLESRKRREHLSAEDLKKNKELLDSLSRGFFVENSCDQPCVRRESIQPPPPSPVSWEEYVTAPSGRWPHLGRPMVVKESRKSLKATVAMSEEFPIRLDRLLDVLEIIAPFKHFLKLREFVQLKLPSGFPVKIEIPVLPTITAKITFQDFQARDSDYYPQSFFLIPNNFKEDPNRCSPIVTVGGVGQWVQYLQPPLGGAKWRPWRGQVSPQRCELYLRVSDRIHRFSCFSVKAKRPSAGCRACPGEPMARSDIFLLLGDREQPFMTSVDEQT